MHSHEILDSFLSKEDFETVLEETSKCDWRALKQGGIDKSLDNNSFYTDYMLNLINNKSNKNFKLYRVLAKANSRHEGMSIHQDSDNHTHTAILYVGGNYPRNCLGGTILFYNDENIYIDYKPNRLLIFDGKVFHRGIYYSDLFGWRYQIVWHIKETK